MNIYNKIIQSWNGLAESMRKCTMCGDIMLTSEEFYCYRCKGEARQLGAKREIYNTEDIKQSQDRFAEVFLGTMNYREMRKRNLSE